MTITAGLFMASLWTKHSLTWDTNVPAIHLFGEKEYRNYMEHKRANGPEEPRNEG